MELKGGPQHFEFPRIWHPDDKITRARETQMEKQGEGTGWSPSSSCRESQAGCECVGSEPAVHGGQAFGMMTDLALLIQEYIFHCSCQSYIPD